MHELPESPDPSDPLDRPDPPALADSVPRLRTARLLLREWPSTDLEPFADPSADPEVTKLRSRPSQRRLQQFAESRVAGDRSGRR